MARLPSTSKKPLALPSWAAVHTKPSSVAVADKGSLRFQSTWLSFHEGLGFSSHIEVILNDSTTGLLALIVQSLPGAGNAGSHPGLVGAGPCSGAAPEAGLNCGRPSKDWSGKPLAAQYWRREPK